MELSGLQAAAGLRCGVARQRSSCRWPPGVVHPPRRELGRGPYQPAERSAAQPGSADLGPAADPPPATDAAGADAPSPDSDSGGKGFWNVGRLRQQLKSLGLAGVVAYGLFNTIYYTVAFLFIWIYVAKVPSGIGPTAAAKAFVQVMGLTWAGSQVTKAPRAAGALLLAPAVDRGLAILEERLKLRSRQQAFLVVVGCCLAFALVLFGGVVLAWS